MIRDKNSSVCFSGSESEIRNYKCCYLNLFNSKGCLKKSEVTRNQNGIQQVTRNKNHPKFGCLVSRLSDTHPVAIGVNAEQPGSIYNASALHPNQGGDTDRLY
jgi:hypothetical protein